MNRGAAVVNIKEMENEADRIVMQKLFNSLREMPSCLRHQVQMAGIEITDWLGYFVGNFPLKVATELVGRDGSVL
jgi:hypothetical protein